MPIQQQQRKKWGTQPPGDGKADVKWDSGTPKAHCKFCGWNDTHSTKYHPDFAENPSTFNICDASPKHPLSLAKLGGGGPTTPTSPPAPKAASPDHVLVSKAHAESVLSNLASLV